MKNKILPENDLDIFLLHLPVNCQNPTLLIDFYYEHGFNFVLKFLKKRNYLKILISNFKKCHPNSIV